MTSLSEVAGRGSTWHHAWVSETDLIDVADRMARTVAEELEVTVRAG